MSITNEEYTPLQFGYSILATKAPSAQQDGVLVALFWRSGATTWQLEDP